MTKLQKRILSAAVLIPVTLAILYFGGWPFILATALVSMIALWEWMEVSKRTKYPIILFIVGAVYISLAAYGFYEMSHPTPSGINLAIILVLTIWVSDISAYVAGKFIGGAKLLPSVSPNKTWAGLAGATIMPAIVLPITIFVMAFLLSGFDNTSSIRNSTPMFFHVMIIMSVFWFIIGGLIGFLGQAGDLLVSLLKRNAGVKDTGDIIPGHGGVLDRVDSMMLPCALLAILKILIII